MYYDRKMGSSSKILKSQGSGSTQQMLSSPMKHDYPYWGGTADPTSYQLNKLSRNQIDDAMVGGELMQTQNYPSYRKKMMQYQQSSATAHSPSHPMRGTFGPGSEFNAREMSNRNSWANTNPNARNSRHQMMAAEGKQPENYSSYADEEPVYEEIQSRTNENCDGSALNDYPHSPTRDSDNLLQNIRVARTNSSHKMDATSQQPLHSRYALLSVSMSSMC